MDPTQILAQIFAAAGVSAGQLPAQIDFSLGNILRAIIILLLVYIVARIARGLLQRGLGRAKIDKRVEQRVLQVVYYGILLLGIIWILGGFGLSVVILGVAVGFAFKDLLTNFAAGLLIMATHPFHIGDWIVVGSSEGRVVEVGWRGTFLDTFDGRRVIIPNANIVNSVVINNSLQSQLRSTINVAVDMQSDFGRVEQLILDALKQVDGIAPTPPPTVLIDSMTGNAMNLSVQFWVAEAASRQRQLMSNALRAIKEALPANDIDLNPATTVSMARAEKPK